MSQFVYSVRDRSGRVIRGVLDASDRNSAIQKLRESGYIIATLKEKKAVAGLGFLSRGKVKLKDLAIFSKQFAAMVDSGIDVLRCLKILEKQTEVPALKEAVAAIRDDVAEGQTLSGAMAKHPKVFPKLYISLIRASEESGALDIVLDRLAFALEKEVNLRNQISAGLKYPQVIAVAAVIVLTIVMVFVIPRFQEMFAGLGGQLPLMTRILISVAVFMKKYWYIILAVYFAFPFGLRFFGNTPGGRMLLDRLKLRLPIFGDLTRKVIIARFSRNLATMLANGIPILRAMDIVYEAAGNVVYEEAIKKIRSSVKQGESIAGPMEAVGVFPPMVTAMVAVGEESGDLDGMLGKISDFYEAEVDATVKALTSLMEPLLISTMGAIVGFIVISLFLPLFKLIKLVEEIK